LLAALIAMLTSTLTMRDTEATSAADEGFATSRAPASAAPGRRATWSGWCSRRAMQTCGVSASPRRSSGSGGAGLDGKMRTIASAAQAWWIEPPALSAALPVSPNQPHPPALAAREAVASAAASGSIFCVCFCHDFFFCSSLRIELTTMD